MSGPVQRPPQLTLGGQEAFELRNALLAAVQQIRKLYSERFWTEEAATTAWRDFFDNAPEMKEIREALERHA